MIIYHGSNVAVPKPCVVINGFYKDFSYGFYCTKIEKQALTTLHFEGSDTL